MYRKLIDGVQKNTLTFRTALKNNNAEFWKCYRLSKRSYDFYSERLHPLVSAYKGLSDSSKKNIDIVMGMLKKSHNFETGYYEGWKLLPDDLRYGGSVVNDFMKLTFTGFNYGKVSVMKSENNIHMDMIKEIKKLSEGVHEKVIIEAKKISRQLGIDFRCHSDFRCILNFYREVAKNTHPDYLHELYRVVPQDIRKIYAFNKELISLSIESLGYNDDLYTLKRLLSAIFDSNSKDLAPKSLRSLARHVASSYIKSKKNQTVTIHMLELYKIMTSHPSLSGYKKLPTSLIILYNKFSLT